MITQLNLYKYGNYKGKSSANQQGHFGDYRVRKVCSKDVFQVILFSVEKEAWLNKLIQQTAAGDCLTIHSEGMQVLCVWNCTKGLFFNVTRYSTLEAYKQEND